MHWLQHPIMPHYCMLQQAPEQGASHPACRQWWHPYLWRLWKVTSPQGKTAPPLSAWVQHSHSLPVNATQHRVHIRTAGNAYRLMLNTTHDDHQQQAFASAATTTASIHLLQPAPSK